MKGDWFECEHPEKPAWAWILEHIRGSKAVFVLLSPTMLGWQVQHTQNWVAWEVGAASAIGKPVIVFEPLTERVPFTVPYCDRQVLYDESSSAHFDWLRGLLDDLIRQWNPSVDVHPNMTCSECGLSFHQYNEGIDRFPCPCCRTELGACSSTH